MPKMKELEHLIAKTEIGRRDFMGRAAALGVSTALATSMWSTSAKAAMGKRGGKLRQALTGGGTGDVLDPAQTLDSYMQNISFGQLRNCLTEIGADGQLGGELAESWEASAKADSWTFKLRKGVEFHNGKSLEAQDIIETFHHHMGEDSKSAAAGITKAIKEVKADDKHTVTFNLDGGSADFPFLVSDYHLCVFPAGGKDFTQGTGGYSLVNFEPGVRTLTKRNPNYWKENAAYFDEVESLFIADVNARTNALKTDQVDVIASPDAKTVNLLKRDPNVQILKTDGNKQICLPMDTRVAPYDNNDVRLALKYAIDREQWLKTILNGNGALGNDHPIGPANVYRNTGLAQRQYDPDKAKFHLKKAGMSNLKVKFQVADTAYGGAVDSGALYRETASKCGIDMEIVREPNDGYWSNVWMKKPFVASYWGGRPTEDWIFSQVYSSGADWNESFWEHEKFNKILIEARAELNADKRRGMYYEMQEIVHNEGGSVIPLFSSYMHALSTKIQLPDQVAGNWEFDGEKNAERWWFK